MMETQAEMPQLQVAISEAVQKYVILDMSHHNGKVNWVALKKAKEEGRVHGLMIKFTQGKSFKDPMRAENARMSREIGLPRGPYHFVNNGPADAQYRNFMAAVTEEDYHFELSPWLDAEAFYSSSIYSYMARDWHLETYNNIYGIEEELPYIGFRMTGIDTFAPVSLSYPTGSIVDSIGMYLINNYPYFKQPWYKDRKSPRIYTNLATAQKMFPSSQAKWKAIAARYGLAVAHWGVEQPLPVWPWPTWENWQEGVFDGKPYGFPSKVDVGRWHPDLPWPYENGTQPPPPPPAEVIRVTLERGGKSVTKEFEF